MRTRPRAAAALLAGACPLVAREASATGRDPVGRGTGALGVGVESAIRSEHNVFRYGPDHAVAAHGGRHVHGTGSAAAVEHHVLTHAGAGRPHGHT